MTIAERYEAVEPLKAIFKDIFVGEDDKEITV
jgi:hypothetical protein